MIKKSLLITSLFSVFLCGILIFFSDSTGPQEGNPESITGLWKSRDQKSDKPRSLVAVYEYQGTYYGRMLATYDDNGKIQDTILEQKDRAKGIVGHPPYCGMDFVYNVKKEKDSDRYAGKIVDPQEGEVYKVKLWRKGEDLIVRGELWIFGKNMPWHPASKNDLPKGFSMGEIKEFVPVVPQTL